MRRVQGNLDKHWMCPLGHVPGSTVIAWPMRLVHVPDDEDKIFFTPFKSNEIRNHRMLYQSVLDLDDWGAYKTEPHSPLWEMLNTTLESRVGEFSTPGVRVFVSGPKESLFAALARSAFGSSVPSLLPRLAKHLGLDIPRGSGHFSLLQLLVSTALPLLPPVDLCDLLVMPLSKLSNDADAIIEEFLDTDDGLVCLDRQDRQSFQKTISTARVTRTAMQTYRADLQSYRNRVRPPSAHTPAPKAKAKGRGKGKHGKSEKDQWRRYDYEHGERSGTQTARSCA